jgi:hypothetical protein
LMTSNGTVTHANPRHRIAREANRSHLDVSHVVCLLWFVSNVSLEE